MNHIEVKSIKTQYDYSEDYCIIDGKPITLYLDEFVRNDTSCSLSDFCSLCGLLPAWSGKLLSQWENDFVWELIDSEEELNVPVLVCEDDCDLSCIVIMVHIRKAGDKVYWDRIGSLNHTNIDAQKERESGILCLEAYTDEDWEKYGDNIATEKYNSPEYWKWVDENPYEEYIRRLRNYTRLYMQKEENIEWIQQLNWVFDVKAYEAVIEYYRKLRNQ